MFDNLQAGLGEVFERLTDRRAVNGEDPLALDHLREDGGELDGDRTHGR